MSRGSGGWRSAICGLPTCPGHNHQWQCHNPSQHYDYRPLSPTRHSFTNLGLSEGVSGVQYMQTILLPSAFVKKVSLSKSTVGSDCSWPMLMIPSTELRILPQWLLGKTGLRTSVWVHVYACLWVGWVCRRYSRSMPMAYGRLLSMDFEGYHSKKEYFR